jgi:hypothetical protein
MHTAGIASIIAVVIAALAAYTAHEVRVRQRERDAERLKTRVNVTVHHTRLYKGLSSARMRDPGRLARGEAQTPNVRRSRALRSAERRFTSGSRIWVWPESLGQQSREGRRPF